ncbi:peptidase M10A and M12B matrixin and adamalysin [Candidatus Parcubacteria bacterium]|nr:MAG: peptidase M10A and M12B matrixin and adamalysin [Candidatus Parcubacteria bacterium]
MLNKTLFASIIIGLVFLAAPVGAKPQQLPVVPAGAKLVADNIFYIGEAQDARAGKKAQGYAIVHYKKNPARGGVKPNKPSGTNCYGFLSKGAKWKTTEDWVVNASNPSGLSSSFILNNLSFDIEKWEDAADGNVGNNFSIDILGNGALTSADLSLGFATMNDVNEVYFAELSEGNAIAVTYIWGFFSGPIQTRELLEWDQIYNTAYEWSSSGESNKMDFENIATHELGHSVGLADLYTSSCSNETMFGYADFGETNKRTPEGGDIAGMNALY